MASAANRLAAAALLAVFVAAAAVQAAPKGWSTPTFHKFQIDARFGELPGQLAASGKASVASVGDGKAATVANEADYHSYYGSDRYYKESKQTCLAETQQRSCATYGCQNAVAGCGDGADAGDCYNCRSGNYYTSDFTCLKEEHYSGPTNFFQSQNTVASCDWTINWLRKDKSDTGGGNGTAAALGTDCTADVTNNVCGWQPIIPLRTYNVGTAIGDCFFSSQADSCGEPLCSRLSVTLQGSVYVSAAYSHDAGIFTARDPCSCFQWDNIDNGDCNSTNVFPWDASFAAGGDTGRRMLLADRAGGRAEAASYGSHCQQTTTTAAAAAPPRRRPFSRAALSSSLAASRASTGRGIMPGMRTASLSTCRTSTRSGRLPTTASASTPTCPGSSPTLSSWSSGRMATATTAAERLSARPP